LIVEFFFVVVSVVCRLIVSPSGGDCCCFSRLNGAGASCPLCENNAHACIGFKLVE
jgi:hypothetical protein